MPSLVSRSTPSICNLNESLVPSTKHLRECPTPLPCDVKSIALPPDTSFTFVTLPLVTVMSAVAPTPLPSLFLSGTALYTPSLYPDPPANSFGSSLDIPTLTVIVSHAIAVIARVLPDAGSPDLGYACSEAWLSASQVNVMPPSAIVIVLLVVKL